MDIIGSVYKRHNIKSKGFELFSSNSRFTDDSVLTIKEKWSQLIDKIEKNNNIINMGFSRNLRYNIEYIYLRIKR